MPISNPEEPSAFGLSGEQLFQQECQKQVTSLRTWMTNRRSEMSRNRRYSESDSLQALADWVYAHPDISSWRWQPERNQTTLWVNFDGVELLLESIPDDSEGNWQYQYLLRNTRKYERSTGGAIEPTEEVLTSIPEKPLWISRVVTHQGPEILLERLKIVDMSSDPLAGWPPHVREEITKMTRHPNGLVVCGHRGSSVARDGSIQVFQAIAQAQSGAKVACIGNSLRALPYHSDWLYFRVPKDDPAAWSWACQSALNQGADLFLIRGRDAQEAVAQAILTALEDRWVVVDVPLVSVADILRWLISKIRVDDLQLAEVLLGVVASYHWVRRVCPHCAVTTQPAPELLERLQPLNVKLPSQANWMQGQGCDRCYQTGYQNDDRLTIAEALYVDQDWVRFLTTEPSMNEIASALLQAQFSPRWQSALALAEQGLTTLKEAVHYSFGRRADY